MGMGPRSAQLWCCCAVAAGDWWMSPGIAQCRAYKAKHLISIQASKFPLLASYIAFISQADTADVSLSSSDGWDTKNQARKPMEM